jgi:hypothetical protein
MLDDAILGEADDDEEPAEIQYAAVVNKPSSVIVASAADKDNRAAVDNKQLTSKDNSCMPDNAKKIFTLPRIGLSEAKPVTRTYSKKEGQQAPTGDNSVIKRDDSSKAKKPPLPSPKVCSLFLLLCVKMENKGTVSLCSVELYYYFCYV